MENSEPLNLLSMNMCSPMVVFTIFSIVIGLSMFMTRNSLKRFNSHKMDNLFKLHSLEEVKLLIVLGATIYGLCQYNQVNMAWIFLIFPVIYFVIRNVLIFIPVSNAHQNLPKQVEYLNEPVYVEQVRQENNHQMAIQKQQMKMVNPMENAGVNKDIGGMGMVPPLNSGMGSGTPLSGLDRFDASPY